MTKDEDKMYPFVCGICLEKYKSLSKYHEHIKSHGVIEEDGEVESAAEEAEIADQESRETFTCGVCQTQFQSMSSLHDHMVKQEKISSYSYSDVDHTARVHTETPQTPSPQKRGRGRPRKYPANTPESSSTSSPLKSVEKSNKRGPGRPRKVEVDFITNENRTDELTADGTPNTGKRGRGRPPKLKVNYDHEADVDNYDEMGADDKVKSESTTDGFPNTGKRGRGRPPKVKVEDLEEDDDDEIGVDDEYQDEDYNPFDDIEMEEPLKKRKLDSTSPKRRVGRPTLKEQAKMDASKIEIMPSPRSRRSVKAIDYKALAGLASPAGIVLQQECESVEKLTRKSCTKKKTETGEEYRGSKGKGVSVVDLHNSDIQEVDDEELAAEAFMDFMAEDGQVVEPDDVTVTKKGRLKLSRNIKNKYLNGTYLRKRNMLYACKLCGKFLQYEQLKRHKISHIREKMNVICSFCGKKYKSQFRLNDHMRYSHPPFKYKCSLCDKVLNTKKYMECHLAQHILLKDVEETSVDDIPYEVEKNHELDYMAEGECLNAEQETTVTFIDASGNELVLPRPKNVKVETVEIETVVIKNENGQDEMMFQSKDGLFEMVKNREVIDKWKAKKLGLADKAKDRMAGKVESKTNEEKNNKEEEVNEEEKANDEDTITVEILDKDKEPMYNDNVEVKTNNARYCNLCNKMFRNKAARERHQRRLHDNQIYFCVLCKKELTRKEYYVDHMKWHVNRGHIAETEVNFNATVNRLELGVMVNIDDDDDVIPPLKKKNTFCFLCKKDYYIRDRYTMHMRKVHNPMVYLCQVCNKIVKRKEVFRTHMMLHVKKDEIKYDDVNFNKRVRLRNTKLENSVYINLEDGKPIDGDDSLALLGDFDEIAEAEELNDEESLDMEEGKVSMREDGTEAVTVPSKQSVQVAGRLRLGNRSAVRVEELDIKCAVCGAEFDSRRMYGRHRVVHLQKTDPYHSEEVVKQLQAEIETEQETSVVTLDDLTPNKGRWVSCEICGKVINSKRLKVIIAYYGYIILFYLCTNVFVIVLYFCVYKNKVSI